MIDYYNIIDVALVVIIGYSTFYYYNKKIYLKLFDYFKIFILIAISAKFAIFTGSNLEKFSIISTDTNAIMTLIGFTLNFAILFYGYKFIFKIINNVINSQVIRTYLAQLTTLLEVVVIVTFLLFMTMQLKPSKIFLAPSMQKTVTYPYIKSFYMKFLNKKFINMIINNDGTMDTKEIIFKSLKDSV